MASYTHVWEIPDQGSMKGGDLYDKHGNLQYFADVSSLDDKNTFGADKQVQVKSHRRKAFMRDDENRTVAAHIRNLSVGLRNSKGGTPGYTITLASDLGLVDEEKREFQYTGTMSALVSWLKTTAKMQVHLYGKKGTPYKPIPGVSP